MVFATLLGLAVMTVSAWFAWLSVQEMDGYLQLIPLALGFLMGFAFFSLGALTIIFGRMKLVLNRTSGEGVYEVKSPVIDVGKPCNFRLENIDSVTIERVEEDRPRNGETGSFPAKVCRARLRIRKPRRVIVLDETENNQERRVSAVAKGVADWLEMEVVENN